MKRKQDYYLRMGRSGSTNPDGVQDFLKEFCYSQKLLESRRKRNKNYVEKPQFK